MNELGTAIIWSALRVTVFGVLALALYGLVIRRGPRVGASIMILSLLAILLLTPLALCPWPESWLGNEAKANGIDAEPEREVVSESKSTKFSDEVSFGEEDPTGAKRQAAGGWVWSPSLFKKLGTSWNHIAAAPVDRSWGWQGKLAVVFLVGTGCCVVRLGIGCCAVQSCCRRAFLIQDFDLQKLVESLRQELKIHRHVEVRESADVAGAATVGWLHPRILLPPDWSTWTDEQRRAVLAHELAHIAGYDYLTWFIARVTLALHFYHPLVWWLTNRL